jgi:predicted MPP superfamily phosphohydrolase
MRMFFPLIFAASMIFLLGLFEVVLLRFLNRDWWQIRYIRLAAWGLPIFGTAMVMVWGVGEYNAKDWLAYPGAVLAVGTFVLEISLMLSLPVSGLIHTVHRLIDRIASRVRPEAAEAIDTRRRLLLKGFAAALPVITTSTGVAGVARSFSDIRLREMSFLFDSLPPDLEGFKILHLSDLHLSHYVKLDDLADVLERAQALNPDLVLLTGDVADRLNLLPDALRLITQLDAPYGTFASLGNHEYYRGIVEVKRAFDRSPVPLLVNSSVNLTVGTTTVTVSGLDDPLRMGRKNSEFFRRCLGEALDQSAPRNFTLVMSHRPDALDEAAAVDVDLVLSGHTHGGQIGFSGRSVFDSVWPDRYLWGHYRMRRTQLYTSAGMGHWFPFRLGCPTEAPLIQLRKGA